MADDEKDARSEKKKGGRVWNALPRRPRLFKKSPLSAREEANKFSRGLRDVHHNCPHDGAAMQLMEVYPTTKSGDVEQGAEPYRALVCPECSFTVPVSVLIDRLRRDAQPLKNAEKQFTIFAFVIVALAAAISMVNGNLLTFLGALVLALTLLVKALFYRYRYWQAERGRLFESESPFRDWLREEMRGTPEKTN